MAGESYTASVETDGINAIVTTQRLFSAGKVTTPKDGSKLPEVNQDDSNKDFFYWGTDNLWPQNTYDIIRKDDIIPSLVKWKTDAIYGGGLVYGMEFIENGQLRFEQVMNAEIEDWLENTDIQLYLTEAPRDKYSYGNFYPKLIPMLKGSGEIKELYCEDATFCRMGKQMGTNRLITKVHVSGDWKNDTEKSQLVYDAVDRYGDVKTQIQAIAAKGKQMIMPMFYRVNGNVAYEVPSWYGLKESGWLELSQQIPIFKKTKMANSAVLRLHIEIHPQYFVDKYPGWDMNKDKYTEDERQKIVAKEAKHILDSISGHDKAGKAFMSGFFLPPGSTQPVSMVKITPFVNAKEGGDYIEDSQEADYHKIRSFGVDPTLYGATPGSKNLAGSGSDKRVALNHYVMLNHSDQKQILHPLQVVATMNGWHEKVMKEMKMGDQVGRLRFRMMNYHIAKLEEGKEIKQEKTQADGTGNEK